jgi:hypothetical protein
MALSRAADLAEAYAHVGRSGQWPSGAVRRVRDLLIVDSAEMALVIACDSNAASGPKPADHLAQDPRTTGYSAAKVPLMEVIASGATPLVLIDNLCCELDPTGRGILEGINEALCETVGGVTVTGSDETNMPTVQTGVGVTVLGVASSSKLRVGTADAGNTLVCVGTPKNGTTVPYSEGDPDIASVSHIEAVSRSNLATEILPVGSRGVRYEANQLASTAGMTVAFEHACTIDLEISAGASTCFLVALSPERTDELARITTLPLAIVARLH